MPRGSLSVRERMILLLALTVAVVTAVFFIVQHSLGAQLELLVRERTSESGRLLDRVLDLRASGASVHADDYTRWDDFVSFARNPDPQWGRLYITESIGTFGVDAAWVLNDRFRLIFTANPKGDPALTPVPAPPGALSTALHLAAVRHFFAATRAGILELWTSPIQPSSDFARKAVPSGYYIIGRVWTPKRMTELSKLVDGTVALDEGDAPAPGPPLRARRGRSGYLARSPTSKAGPSRYCATRRTTPALPACMPRCAFL
jgi:hypothetical protein